MRKKAIQRILERQKPKSTPKIHPKFTWIPDKWEAEITDEDLDSVDTGRGDRGFLELYGGLIRDYERLREANANAKLAELRALTEDDPWPPDERKLGINPAVEGITIEEVSDLGDDLSVFMLLSCLLLAEKERKN